MRCTITPTILYFLCLIITVHGTTEAGLPPALPPVCLPERITPRQIVANLGRLLRDYITCTDNVCKPNLKTLAEYAKVSYEELQHKSAKQIEALYATIVEAIEMKLIEFSDNEGDDCLSHYVQLIPHMRDPILLKLHLIGILTRKGEISDCELPSAIMDSITASVLPSENSLVPYDTGIDQPLSRRRRLSTHQMAMAQFAEADQARITARADEKIKSIMDVIKDSRKNIIDIGERTEPTTELTRMMLMEQYPDTCSVKMGVIVGFGGKPIEKRQMCIQKFDDAITNALGERPVIPQVLTGCTYEGEQDYAEFEGQGILTAEELAALELKKNPNSNYETIEAREALDGTETPSQKPAGHLQAAIEAIREQLDKNEGSCTIITLKTGATVLVATYKQYPRLIEVPVKILWATPVGRDMKQPTQFYLTFNGLRDKEATKWLFMNKADSIVVVGGGISWSQGMRQIVDFETAKRNAGNLPQSKWKSKGFKGLNKLLNEAELGTPEHHLKHTALNFIEPMKKKWTKKVQEKDFGNKTPDAIQNMISCVETWARGEIEMPAVNLPSVALPRTGCNIILTSFVGVG